MKKSILVILLLTVGFYLGAQDPECKVNKPEISGTYQGGCKNGLANGKGVAQGRDRYEGQFFRGLPNGKGKYQWADGHYYDGEWRNGVMEGKGKMVYADSAITGFWKNNKFAGKKQLIPYRILRTISVTRYTIIKSHEPSNGIRLRIMQGGGDNSTIEDFSMAYDSGNEYRNGSYYGLENVLYPLNLKVKYRSWNLLRTSQYDVIFEIEITEPGTWDITLSN
jgi:hypothetical protein